MKKRLTLPMKMPQRDFVRRGRQILSDIQKTLLPEHARDIVAINVDTGEYVVAPTNDAAWEAFLERWPDHLAYVVRADGGPVVKFHGK